MAKTKQDSNRQPPLILDEPTQVDLKQLVEYLIKIEKNVDVESETKIFAAPLNWTPPDFQRFVRSFVNPIFGVVLPGGAPATLTVGDLGQAIISSKAQAPNPWKP